MLLAIDIGNSQIFYGVFDGQTLRHSWRLATDHTKTTDEYGMAMTSLMQESGIAPRDIQASILSSVVPPVTPTLAAMVETFFHHIPLVVSAHFPFGLTIDYPNVQEIGTDRLVNAAAAFERYRTSLIIVDFGTATTFCTITKDGRYLGGAHCPRVTMFGRCPPHPHSYPAPRGSDLPEKRDRDRYHQQRAIRVDFRTCRVGG